MQISIERVCVPTSSMFPYRDFPTDLSALTVELDDDRPWLGTIVERLDTNAPADAQPWCCYVKTVIFYEQPFRTVSGGKAFAVHDEIDTLLCGADIVAIDGIQFELYGGQVQHDGRGWIMHRKCRRLPSDRQVPLPPKKRNSPNGRV